MPRGGSVAGDTVDAGDILRAELLDLGAAVTEHLAALEGTDLRHLGPRQHLAALRRAAHTLFALGGLFDLADLAASALALEDLLDALAFAPTVVGPARYALLVGSARALVAHVSVVGQVDAGRAGPRAAGAALDRLRGEVDRLAAERSLELRLVISVGSALDRPLLDSLTAPLLHLIRNAVDHGVERPDARSALGKPRAGTITLDVRRRDGHVVVAVEDDGAGVDVAGVRSRAVAHGLLAEEAAAAMTDRELLASLPMHGLSTRVEVSATSGRGVGLDAVRVEVERRGGTVVVESGAGRFTRVEITLPEPARGGR